MNDKNGFWFGLFLGLLMPTIAFLLTTYTGLIAQWMPSKPIGFYVIAFALNVVVVWWSYRNDRAELGKGIAMTTFLTLLVAVFTKQISI